jgi:UDP-N-acetylmuramate dehydrogenase
MNKEEKSELIRIGGGDIQWDISMADYTSFRTGGPLEALFEASDPEKLVRVLRFLRQERIPYMVLGRGSNLLVTEGGLEGVAIRLSGSLAEIGRDGEDGLCVHAGGGGFLPNLVSFCGSEGLSGLEFLAGIPGTVGGAVAMNAGAFGKEVQEVIRQITLIDRKGEVIERGRGDLIFSYRHLEMEEGSIVIGVRFQLARENPEKVRKRISEHLRRRKETQPLEFPSAGSVFKNPPGDYAGRLIESAGLKGERVGGAMVSTQHANYIVNVGGATTEDILALARLVHGRVRQETGVELEMEIRVVGR